MRRPLLLAAICLVSVMGFMLHLGVFDRVPNGQISAEALTAGESLTMTGQVYQKDSEKLYLQSVQIISLAGSSQPNVSCKDNLICILEQEADIPLGSKMLITGTFQPFSQAANPGEFDSREYYRTLGIGGKVKSAVALAQGESFWRLREALSQLRSLLKERLGKVFPEKEAAVMCALLLGDKGDLDPELKELYQRNGILHILSISSLHITMIGMTVYKLLRKCRVPVCPAAAAGCVLLLLYGMMTGFSVSAGRAIGMYLLRMTAEMTGRTYDMPTAMGVMAAVLVIRNPYYLQHTGFLLSFSSMTGIGIVYPAMEVSGRKKSVKERLLEPVLSGISISLGTLPIQLWFYYQVPGYSVLLNILVLPFMKILMAAGFLSLIPGLGICGRAGWLILRGYELLCGLFDGFPFHTWNPGKPRLWQIAVYYPVLAAAVWCRKYLKDRSRERQEGRGNGQGASMAESGRNGQGASMTESGRKGQGASMTESRRNGQGASMAESRRNGRGASMAESGRNGQGASMTESGRNSQGASMAESRRNSQGASMAESRRNGQGASMAESGRNSQGASMTESRRNGQGASMAESRRKGQGASMAENCKNGLRKLLAKSRENGQRKTRPENRQENQSWRYKIGSAACYVVLLLSPVIFTWRPPAENQLLFLDVGQGDGILVRTASGENYLFDGGSSSRSQVGKYVLLPCLRYYGIQTLDAVILSHPDADHVNGVMELLSMGRGSGIRIKQLVLPELSESGREEMLVQLRQFAEQEDRIAEIPTGYLSAGETFDCDRAEFLCLHPPNGWKGTDPNAYSVCIYGIFTDKDGEKEFDFLMTGDVEDTGEDALLAELHNRGIQGVSLLKVAHHGSRHSTSGKLLEQVSPVLAVISCGRNNRYGHPHQELLERLEDTECVIVTTGEKGAVKVNCERGMLRVETFK